MNGAKLELSSTWTVGNLLDRGGFGQVYELADGPSQAVVKFIPKAPGADRELLFVDLGAVRNVVPIIDSGEHQDFWVLVMPKAEKSLRRHLEESGGVLEFDEALAVLLDIADALVDLDGVVVHRDLKPENVLLLDGSWCLADFGISRYAEASTAPDTQKWALTAAYASPERWRAEHATSAADVYALGVMGFEMLTGNPPFVGPMTEDFRDQHLHTDAPALQGVPIALATVLDECLFKSAGARPSPQNLAERLARHKSAPPTGGLAALQAANQGEVRRIAQADRDASREATVAERRAERASAAETLYDRIANGLRDAILDAAPAATLSQDRNAGYARKLGWAIRLADAELIVADCTTRDASWGGWQEPAFNVDAWGGIALRIPSTQHQYKGRAHSLWFGDIQQGDSFGWYETAFMLSPLSGKGSAVAPFALDPGEESAKAVWTGVAEFQVAWPFTRLDLDNLGDFIERWATWFAAAANNQLSHPSTMPERPVENSWRRA